MYIINLALMCVVFLFLYGISTYSQKSLEKVFLLFSVYAFTIILSITTLKDVYYVYLMYKLLNIVIYMVLVVLSNNPVNIKAVVNYYFVRFISSLLFISRLYNLTGNNISIYVINIAILMKLSVYPVHNIIAKVYKNSSMVAYLFLSYVVNYIYILCLFIFNLNNPTSVPASYDNIVILGLAATITGILTLLTIIKAKSVLIFNTFEPHYFI